jgi:N12 class adenine-specific DNA methylase/2'-5' RNA ligase
MPSPAVPGLTTPFVGHGIGGDYPIPSGQIVQEPFETIPALETIGRGVTRMAQATPTPTHAANPKQTALGLSEVLGGTMQAVGPLAIPAGLVAAPAEAAISLGAGIVARTATPALLKKAGVAPEYADLAGDVAGLLAGYAAGHIRLSPEQQNLIEVLQGKDAPGAGIEDPQVNLLRNMVDRGGTEGERAAAQGALFRKFGIKYGPEDLSGTATPEQSPTPQTAPTQEPATGAAATGAAPTSNVSPEVSTSPVKFSKGEVYTNTQGEAAHITQVSPDGTKISFELTVPGVIKPLKLDWPVGKFQMRMGLTPRAEAQEESGVNAAPAVPSVAGTTVPQPGAVADSNAVPTLQTPPPTPTPTANSQPVQAPPETAGAIPPTQQNRQEAQPLPAITGQEGAAQLPQIATAPEGLPAPDAAAAGAAATPKFDYASTQVNLPSSIANSVIYFGETIPAKILAPEAGHSTAGETGSTGRETEPHITIKYGLHDEDPSAVQEILKNEGPITATLGKASIFNTDDSDVLKVGVESPDLQRLNGLVSQLPHTDTHPTYEPHVTIAYLKKGEGAKYDGKSIPGVTGQTVSFDAVQFSDKNGQHTAIPLAGNGQESGVDGAPATAVSGAGRPSGASQQLPHSLTGAKPRYSYGARQYDLEFADDLDKAAYITAQDKRSKHDADYLKWAMGQTGGSEMDVRQAGANVRHFIKDLAKANSDARSGETRLDIPALARKILSKPTTAATVVPAGGAQPTPAAATSNASPELTPWRELFERYITNGASETEAKILTERRLGKEPESQKARKPEIVTPPAPLTPPVNESIVEPGLPNGTPSSEAHPELAAPESGGGEANAPEGQPGELGPSSLEPAGGSTVEPTPEGNAPSGSAGAGERGIAATPRTSATGDKPADYRITPEDHIGEGSIRQKANDNLEAIRTLKKIEAEGRYATPEEQKILVKYVGWGGMPQPFADWGIPREWQGVRAEMDSLMTAEEFKSARASTPNAHYTSPLVISKIWDAVRRLGLGAEASYLEPAMGVGHFYGLMPEDLLNGARRTGIELDALSGRISKLLYPETDIHIAGFETVRLPGNFFDAAVSNVPFGNYAIHDPAFKRNPVATRSIHDYFFAKALEKVRPGGLVAFITSNFTMDKRDPSVRKYLASQADLLGAIRLPNSAFKGNAGTEVTTDVIFLRKRAPGQKPAAEPWTDLAEIQGNVERPDRSMGKTAMDVNEYYAAHPEMMLGEMGLLGTMYADKSAALTGQLTPEKLDAAIARLPEGAIHPWEAPVEQSGPVAFADAKTVKDGGYAMKDGQLVVRHGDSLIPATNPDWQVKRIKGMLEIRNALREVFRTQIEDASEPEIKKAIRHLNTVYDHFVKQNGYLSQTQNVRAFHGDPDAPVLLSLEKWDPEAKKAEKTPVFTQRTVSAAKRIDTAGSAKEALAISLNEKGRIDWVRMQQLTGQTPAEMQAELGPLIYQNPNARQWQTAEEYLSGNVRQKLAEARAAAGQIGMQPQFQRNVEALEAVQPKDLQPEDIEAKMGASWIPRQYISQFVGELLGVDPRYIQVSHSEALATWTMKVQVGNSNVANVKTYGTDRFLASDLIEMALNMRNPTAYDEVGTGADKKTVINEKETLAAREMQQQLKDRFREWVWQDPGRAETLGRLYNDEFNSLRLREYDGSHLELPGMSASIKLRPHQKNAIWRVVSSGGNTLLAHVVGAGKTYEMIGGAMELRRLGLAKKPVLVVLKNRVEPTGAEFLSMYPGANILVMTPEQFTAANRAKVMARIATGNWDAVIVSYESFEKLPVSDETFNSYLNDQIDDLENYIREMKADNSDAKLVKQMEKAKKSLEAKLRGKADRESKDTGIGFEELGVDSLFVDEADNFKNLFFPTKMTRIRGLPNTESKRAFDMYIKTQTIAKRNGGRGIVFATGTPIANTMAEMWTMQRYLQPDYLREHGLQHFDAWAQTFGEVVPTLEVSPDASGFRLTNRFAKFVNIPELVSGFRLMADVQTADMLKLPVPRLKGGQRTTVPAPASPEQTAYLASLAQRAKDIREGRVKDPRIDNMLKVSTDGRKSALDMRLVDRGAEDFRDSKVNKVVDKVVDIWKATAKNNSAQLVFLDFSKPAEPGEGHKFSVYDDIKAKLLARGIPAKQIAFIHDAASTEEAAQLSHDVNAGRIRVLMGSTQKMGVGLNLQKRLIALHHLDAPWRPRDIEQREGRILRQGNENPEVQIYQYVTEPSFDAKMWDTLKTKAQFIGQVMRGEVTVRTADDVADSALTYAEVAAIASGNPAIREKTVIDAEVRKLDAMRSRHDKQQADLKREAVSLPQRIQAQSQAAAKYQKDIAVRDASPNQFTVGKQTFTGDDARKRAAAAIAKVLDTAKDSREPISFGSYRGFALETRYRQPGITTKGMEPQPLPDITIRGASSYGANTNPDEPLGTLQSIEIAVRGIDGHLNGAVANMTDAQRKLADTNDLLGKPFEQEAKLKTLLDRQRALAKELQTDAADQQAASANLPQPEEEGESVAAAETDAASKNTSEAGFLKFHRPGQAPPMPENLRKFSEDTGETLHWDGSNWVADSHAETEQATAAQNLAVQEMSRAYLDPSDKRFGERIRTSVTGMRDVWIAQTNQLRGRLRKLLPNYVDREALTLMREFRNRPGEMRQFLEGTHPFYGEMRELSPELAADAAERMEKLEPVVERAENPTPEMIEADRQLTEYFTEHLAEGKELGFIDSDIPNEEYITHLLQPDENAPSRISRTAARLFPTRAGLGPKRFQFAKGRIFPTVMHGIAAGKAYHLDATDALTIYGEKWANQAALRTFLNVARDNAIGKWGTDSGLRNGKIPANWVAMAPENRAFRNEVPYINAQGEADVAHQNFYVEPSVNEAMRPIFDPDYTSRIPGAKEARLYNAYIKAAELALSLFHPKALTLSALASDGPFDLIDSWASDMDSPEFERLEREAIRAGAPTAILGRTVEAYKAVRPSSLPTKMDTVRGLPGIKQAEQAAAAMSHATFDVLQRKYKVLGFAQHDAAWMANHPDATPEEHFEAQRLIAKYINGVFGGLHWENLGIQRMALTIARLIFLAPDWTFSNLATGKYTFDGGPGGDAARKFWLGAIFWFTSLSLATSLLFNYNKKFRDVFKEWVKDPTQVYVGEDNKRRPLHMNMFFPGATGDLGTLLHAAYNYGVPVGMARYIANKESPLAKAATHQMANEDELRRPIVRKTGTMVHHQPVTFAQNTAAGVKQLASDVVPVPFTIPTIVRMLEDKDHKYTEAQYAAVVLNGRPPLPLEPEKKPHRR